MSNLANSTRTFMRPPDQKKDKPTRPPRRARPRLHISRSALPWLLVAVLLIVSLVLFWQTRHTQNKLSGDKNADQKYERKLRSFTLLPNESPTVATVQDTSRLKSQLFFARAQAGDKVFVYKKAGKAVLYRPTTNKIVNMQQLSSTNQ